MTSSDQCQSFMIGVIGDDNGRGILQLGILRCSVSAIEFTLGAKMTIVDWISKNVEWLFSGYHGSTCGAGLVRTSSKET